MATYCTNAAKSKFTITFKDEPVKIFAFNIGNIDVTRADVFEINPNSNIRCWLFEGTGYDDAAYKLYVAGESASYLPDSQGRLRPYVDGNYPQHVGYFFRPGATITDVIPPSPTRPQGLYDSGSCNLDARKIKHHEYTFTFSNQSFKVKGLADSDLIAECDSQCPDGYFRCECDIYPGFCCLPCSDIKTEVASIKSIIQSLYHG